MPRSLNDLESLPERLLKALFAITMTPKSRPWRRRGSRQGPGSLGRQAIRLLSERPDYRPTITELATGLCVKLPTISEMVRHLARAGLVRKHASPTDFRSYRLSLTGKGRRLGSQVARDTSFLLRAVDQLSVDDQRALDHLLSKLLVGMPTR